MVIAGGQQTRVAANLLKMAAVLKLAAFLQTATDGGPTSEMPAI
jgi:hypothetical protein